MGGVRLATAMVVLSGLGCAGLSPAPEPPPQAVLLSLLTEGKACHIDLIVVPGGERHPVAEVPGSCRDWRPVLSGDGARLLLQGIHAEVDLAGHKATALPPLPSAPHMQVEDLYYDAQGSPTAEISVPEGEPTAVPEAGEVYPIVRNRRYTLKDGKWALEASEAGARTSGVRLWSAGTEISDAVEVTDAPTRAALEGAAGVKAERWYLRAPVAWAVSDEGEAGMVARDPILLALHGEWKALPPSKGSSIALELRGRWLRISSYPSSSSVIDTETGEVGWSGAGPLMFWPEGVPLPAL